MKARTVTLAVAIACIAVCALGTRVILAQTPSQALPPAYYISEFELSDPEGIKPYSQQVETTFTPFSGRYLVRGGQTASLEGEPPKRIVIIAFDSMAQAQAWYDSPGYRAIRPIRLQSAKSRVYLVGGVPDARSRLVQ